MEFKVRMFRKHLMRVSKRRENGIKISKTDKRQLSTDSSPRNYKQGK